MNNFKLFGVYPRSYDEKRRRHEEKSRRARVKNSWFVEGKEPDWEKFGQDELIRLAAINAWHTAKILGQIRLLLSIIIGGALGVSIKYQLTGSWFGPLW